MWLLRQYITDAAQVALKQRVVLTSYANYYHIGALKLYSDIAQFRLKRYVTPDDNVRLEADVHKLRHISMNAEKFTQEMLTKTLDSGPVYDKMSFKALFVEVVTHSITKTI